MSRLAEDVQNLQAIGFDHAVQCGMLEDISPIARDAGWPADIPFRLASGAARDVAWLAGALSDGTDRDGMLQQLLADTGAAIRAARGKLGNPIVTRVYAAGGADPAIRYADLAVAVASDAASAPGKVVLVMTVGRGRVAPDGRDIPESRNGKETE